MKAYYFIMLALAIAAALMAAASMADVSMLLRRLLQGATVVTVIAAFLHGGKA